MNNNPNEYKIDWICTLIWLYRTEILTNNYILMIQNHIAKCGIGEMMFACYLWQVLIHADFHQMFFCGIKTCLTIYTTIVATISGGSLNKMKKNWNFIWIYNQMKWCGIKEKIIDCQMVNCD